MLKTSGDSLAKGSGLVGAVATSVPEHSLESYRLDSTPTTNHVLSLNKRCPECFIEIGRHRIERQYTEKTIGDKVKKQCSKLIPFKHQ